MTGVCVIVSDVYALIRQPQILEEMVARAYCWKREIGRERLNLACRHHISDIMLEKVLSLYVVSKSSNMELFGHFKVFWPRIDQATFSTDIEDEQMAARI